MNRKVRLGLVGCGTVGRGVIKILENNRRSIEEKTGASIEIVATCDRRRISVKNARFYTDYRDIIAAPDIDMVVELIGGYEPARTIILSALRAGKNVVTANKAVLAKYWDEILRAARKHDRLVYFEAAVGGGIPVVQGLNEGLAANRIEKISGILNGTTNFILSEMTQNDVDFKSALKSAQVAGFAEADPTFDVEGIDTAHKLAVLASLAWSSWVKLGDITTIGIGGVSREDISFARDEYGYLMKLIGSAHMTGGRLELSVQPCLIARTHPFANVEKEYNAVCIHGDAADDIMFYGKGAGQLPAASAVVSDIIFLARQIAGGTVGKLPYVTYNPDKKLSILPREKSEGCHYLHFNTVDKPGVLSTIAGILSRYRVSIASVYQREPLIGVRSGVSIVMLTHKIICGDLLKALERIDSLPIVRSKTVHYKILD
ncbi:MAG: hypothetical protein A2219_06175 [Elusimicrobia bacterium RIFOXYA2_FULL_50_26]|nr:MAG: hypothetical protein A2219_06175 [Elusimicrobia bacterium RIFOXYA2_FULL_50_26]